MNLKKLSGIAALAMAAAGGSVYAVTPAGGFQVPAEAPPVDGALVGAAVGLPDPGVPLGQLAAGSTVRVEGRVGHPRLIDRGQDTFLLLEVTGGATAPSAAASTLVASAPAATPANADLSIVIDKSGSMRGDRIANALTAAVGAVERLRDGDHVSVVAFDTAPELVVARSVVSPETRGRIIDAIRAIRLGGDTCISCGIDAGLFELRGASASGAPGAAPRMLLLSDGKPTAGVRDVGGFRAIGERALAENVGISTIGLELDFNEEIMTAIAVASNGRHYFVENDGDLPGVFEQEAAQLSSNVASSVTAHLDLSPGVELVELVDRPFSRSGSRLDVPLGSLATGETKTILLKVRVSAGPAAERDLATVHVGFRDLASGRDASSDGTLGAALVSSPGEVSPLDGVVAERIQRAETAAALREANALFSEGKTAEAQRRLAEARRALETNKRPALANAPAGRTAGVEKRLDSQERQLREAEEGFAAPSPASPKPDVQRKQETTKKRNAVHFADAAL